MTESTLKRKLDTETSSKQGILRLEALPNYCRHLGGKLFILTSIFQDVPRVHIRVYRAYDGSENLYPTKDGVVLCYKEWKSLHTELGEAEWPPKTIRNINDTGISLTVNTHFNDEAAVNNVELCKEIVTKKHTLIKQSVKLDAQQWTRLLKFSIVINAELVENEIGLKVASYCTSLPKSITMDLLKDYATEMNVIELHHLLLRDDSTIDDFLKIVKDIQQKYVTVQNIKERCVKLDNIKLKWYEYITEDAFETATSPDIMVLNHFSLNVHSSWNDVLKKWIESLPYEIFCFRIEGHLCITDDLFETWFDYKNKQIYDCNGVFPDSIDFNHDFPLQMTDLFNGNADIDILQLFLNFMSYNLCLKISKDESDDYAFVQDNLYSPAD